MTDPAFHEDPTPVLPDWLVIASFWVAGVPQAQPRVKFSSHGKFGRAYTPGGAHKVWGELLYLQAKQHVPDETFAGPVRVWVDMYFPRTAEMEKACYPDGAFEFIQKPDRDNAEKKILDVFTNLGFFKDDKQVCGGEVRKWYVERGGKPGARISIEVNRCWPYKKSRANAARLSPSSANPIDDTCDPANVDSRGGSARSSTSFPPAAAGITSHKPKRKEKLA